MHLFSFAVPRPGWRRNRSLNGMPGFSTAELFAGLVFGSAGFVAFIYGKRMSLWKPMFTGIALMAYPYFVADPVALFGIGVVLTASLFLFRD